jgi:hypothetical protein
LTEATSKRGESVGGAWSSGTRLADRLTTIVNTMQSTAPAADTQRAVRRRPDNGDARIVPPRVRPRTPEIDMAKDDSNAVLAVGVGDDIVAILTPAESQ